MCYFLCILIIVQFVRVFEYHRPIKTTAPCGCTFCCSILIKHVKMAATGKFNRQSDLARAKAREREQRQCQALPSAAIVIYACEMAPPVRRKRKARCGPVVVMRKTMTSEETRARLPRGVQIRSSSELADGGCPCLSALEKQIHEKKSNSAENARTTVKIPRRKAAFKRKSAMITRSAKIPRGFSFLLSFASAAGGIWLVMAATRD